MDDFRVELQHLINRRSMEKGSNTPDFILAQFLTGCLKAFDEATSARMRYENSAKVDPHFINGG